MIGGADRPGGRRPRPGRWAVAASFAVHVAAGGVVWSTSLASPPPLPPFKVYEVKIVSPPPREAGPPTPVEVNAPRVTTPEQPPEQPKPEPKPQPQRKPQPQPPKPESTPKPDPSKAAAVKEEEPKETPAPKPTGPKPDPKAKEAGEGIDIRIEGEEFPFPGYLENIQLQISRYFRWTGRSGLEAEVYFVIRKDGTIEDIRLVRGSGDASFNFEAMAAIEQAGRRGAFGPLPEGFSGDRLPVLFYFRPAR
jgi:TonB family protein